MSPLFGEPARFDVILDGEADLLNPKFAGDIPRFITKVAVGDMLFCRTYLFVGVRGDICKFS